MIKHASIIRKIADDVSQLYPGSTSPGSSPRHLNPVAISNKIRTPLEISLERNRVLPADFKDYTNGDYDKAVSDLFNSFTPAERRQFRVIPDPTNKYDTVANMRRSGLTKMFGPAWTEGDAYSRSVPMCNAVVANVLQRTHGVPIMTNKKTGRIYTVSDINKLIASGNPVLNGYSLEEVPYDKVNNESGLLVIDPTHMGITTNMGGEFGTLNASYGTGLVKGYWGNRDHRSTKASTARNKVAPRFYRFKKLQQVPTKARIQQSDNIGINNDNTTSTQKNSGSST